MKLISPFILLILVCSVTLFADSVWEGTSTLGSYGEFPERGNYGASNSFERNTVIEVNNLDNGNSTTLIIVDRLEQPGIFLLLSKDAAAELGVVQGQLAQVRASLALPQGAIRAFPDDLPFSPDPDVNPAAALVASTDGARQQVAAETTDPETTDPETTDPETTDPETVEPEQVQDPGPAIGDVPPADPDSVDTLENTTPTEEPSPPLEEPEPARVTDLASASDASPVEPRLVVDTPPDPEVEETGAPWISDLMPMPQLDDTERFVLLTQIDEPDTSNIVFDEHPEEDIRFSLLEKPTEEEVETLELILPPEPVFEEKLYMVEDPEPEEILIVSDIQAPLNEPIVNGSVDLAQIDEPLVLEPSVAISSESTDPTIIAIEDREPSLLETQIAFVSADEPQIFVAEEVESDALRVLALAEPDAADDTEDTLPLPDEPVFVALEDQPVAHDIMQVSEITQPADIETEDSLRVASATIAEPAVREKEPEIETKVVVVEPTVEEETDDNPRVINGKVPTLPVIEGVVLSLEPAEPKPPEPIVRQASEERAEVKTPETVVISGAEPLAYTRTLSEKAYYLQLGVFAEADSARRLSDDLSETYPITVFLSDAAGNPTYKVMVGPLNQDESGALLFAFRTRGFKDAFIRRGNVR